MAESHKKLSKLERKLIKRQTKAQATLMKHDGISVSLIPTTHLVVFNGGLGNQVDRELVEQVFAPHGQVVDVTMQPKKPYAFASYSSVDEATAAMKCIHGSEIREAVREDKIPLKFFLAYVEKVPGIIAAADGLPPGLVLLEDVVDEEYEACLLAAVDWQHVDPKIKEGVHGDMKHRRVKHYGYEFLYSVNNIDPECPLDEPVPAVCQPFLDSLQKGGHISSIPDQLTVNQYEPGQGIPPHIDTHSACEDGIVALSLGAQVVMDFRHPDGHHIAVHLPRRSVLIMTGESRYVWTHGITPRKADVIPVKTLRTDEGAHKDCEASAVGNQMNDSEGKEQKSAAIEASNVKLTLIKRLTRTSFTFRKVLNEPCKCKFPAQCDSQKAHIKASGRKSHVDMPKSEEDAVAMEMEHVHKVYEEIAGHFSDTRHTPWPHVVQFLKSLPDGALVADVGCGNGKYLGGNRNCFFVGCDRSSNLCGICAERCHEAFVCDALAVPLRSGCFDAAISIAVIHHLSTHERRKLAVKEIISILRIGGQALLYVWALEQERNKTKSKYLKDKKKHTSSELEEDAASSLDKNCKISSEPDRESGSEDYNSHTSSSGGNQNCSTPVVEVENPTGTAAASNEVKLHVNRTNFEAQDLLVPWHLRGESCKEKSLSADAVQNENVPVFHRYYHVFQEGELEKLCQEVEGIKIVCSYYDQGNWCVILEKI